MQVNPFTEFDQGLQLQIFSKLEKNDVLSVSYVDKQSRRIVTSETFRNFMRMRKKALEEKEMAMKVCSDQEKRIFASTAKLLAGFLDSADTSRSRVLADRQPAMGVLNNQSHPLDDRIKIEDTSTGRLIPLGIRATVRDGTSLSLSTCNPDHTLLLRVNATICDSIGRSVVLDQGVAMLDFQPRETLEMLRFTVHAHLSPYSLIYLAMPHPFQPGTPLFTMAMSLEASSLDSDQIKE
jgi:hypothetical protein